MNVVAIRMDRLGDVLMSLPALDFLRTTLPQAELWFAVRQEVLSAIHPFLSARGIKALATNGSSLGGFLVEQKIDSALVLQAPARVYRELFFRRVSRRFGSYSSIPSYLFLTGGVRQRRSLAERSEGIYNGELAEAFVRKYWQRGDFAGDFTPLLIPTDQAEAKEAESVLAAIGVRGDFLIAHPGMGGSALNLSVERYATFLSEILRTHALPLVFSEGPAASDRALVNGLKSKFPGSSSFPDVSLGVLRELFRKAKAVIAPSTGPLHLAHYVGTSTLGVFSPVRSHRSLRWKPWGGEGKSVVLSPQVDCPATKGCLGVKCPEFSCMEKASWELLLQKADDFIG